MWSQTRENLKPKSDGLTSLIHFFNERKRKLITTELLGKAAIPNLSYENPDGSSIRINTDYFGKPRKETNPTPGPFENPGNGLLSLKVW